MKTTKNGGEKKTERVDSVAMVETTGSACIGGMGSESPFIVFSVGGKKIVWHSDNIESIAQRFGFPCTYDMRGRWINLSANVRLAKHQPTDGIVHKVQKMIKIEDR